MNSTTTRKSTTKAETAEFAQWIQDHIGINNGISKQQVLQGSGHSSVAFKHKDGSMTVTINPRHLAAIKNLGFDIQSDPTNVIVNVVRKEDLR